MGFISVIAVAITPTTMIYFIRDFLVLISDLTVYIPFRDFIYFFINPEKMAEMSFMVLFNLISPFMFRFLFFVRGDFYVKVIPQQLDCRM